MQLNRGRRVGLTSVEGNRLPSESMEFWWQTREPADCLWNNGYGWMRMSSLTMDSGLVHNILTGRVGLTWLSAPCPAPCQAPVPATC